MTTLLEHAIEKVRRLPAERQNDAAQLLIGMAEDQSQYLLTEAERADVRTALSEIERGEFATEKQMADLWKKCGLSVEDSE